MARPDADRHKRQKARSSSQGGLTPIINWMKENPLQAAGMIASSVGFDARPPWMREKQDVKDLGTEAALTAASAVPIVGPIGRVGAKAGQAAKKASDAAKVAQKAAGAAKPRPISGARAGGSGTGQAAGGANRLSARELAAKRRGTRRGRTAEGATSLERQEAAAAARGSVNTGTKSPVAPRPAGTRLPKPAEDTGLMNRIAARRSEALKTGKNGKSGGRNKKEQKRSVEDVKETMRAQLARRDRGARPGEDVPDAKGNLPVGNPAAVTAKTTPRPTGTGTRPNGTTAPAPKPGSAVVSTGRGSTTREATGRRPKRPSSEVATRPGSQVVPGRVVRERREPIDINARPIRRPIGAIGSGRSAGSGGGQVPRAAIGSGASGRPGAGAAAAATGKNKMGKGKKALIGAGAIAAGGLLLNQFDSDKSPENKQGAAAGPKRTPKPRPADLRDKYGRRISRAEYNKREAYRKSLASMSEADRAKARKAEMKRREEYRRGEGASKYGTAASTINRNLWMKEGVSSREANRLIRSSATTAEARKKIEAIKRKKK